MERASLMCNALPSHLGKYKKNEFRAWLESNLCQIYSFQKLNDKMLIRTDPKENMCKNSLL